MKWGCLVPFGVLAALTMCAEIALVIHEVGREKEAPIVPEQPAVKAPKNDWVKVRTPLHDALDAGNIEQARDVLERGAVVIHTHPQDRDKWELTPLHYAAMAGRLEDVLTLLQAGADIEARDRDGNTPLHEAARCNSTQAALMLLQHGAQIHACNDEGSTPLHLAAYYGSVDVARALLQQGATVKPVKEGTSSPLIDAIIAERPNAELVKLLMAAGADVHETHNEMGMGTLHLAVRNNRMDIIPLLLDAGVDVATRDAYQQTALHEAAECGHAEIVQYLLKAGLGVNDKNYIGETPLHLAAAEDAEACMELLIAAGADVLVRTDKNKTPLHYAADCLHMDALCLLLAAGGGEGVEELAEIQMKFEQYVKPLMEMRKKYQNTEPKQEDSSAQ